MTGAKYREIGTHTKNMAARTIPPTASEREENIAQMRIVLNKLVIKRTTKSTDHFNKQVLEASKTIPWVTTFYWENNSESYLSSSRLPSTSSCGSRTHHRDLYEPSAKTSQESTLTNQARDHWDCMARSDRSLRREPTLKSSTQTIFVPWRWSCRPVAPLKKLNLRLGSQGHLQRFSIEIRHKLDKANFVPYALTRLASRDYGSQSEEAELDTPTVDVFAVRLIQVGNGFKQRVK